MKKKYSKSVIYFLTGIALLMSSVVSGQNFSDNATNYDGSWTTGSNQGTGFGAWTFTTGANSGSFIGNPANNGMGTSNIGTTAFGMYATGNNYFSAYRSINNGIQVGDTFSFYWVINFDAGGGSKGFDLRSGGTTIFNVNNGSSSTISTTNGNANTAYGTTPMLVTITRTSASAYSFSMTSRSDGAPYTTTISNPATIDGFNFYIGNQNDGSGQKNMFVNGFSITKPITVADGNWNQTATWLNNTIPPTDAGVTINHNVSLNTDVSLRYVLINSGKTLTASDSTPRTLTISNGGFITNNGTFTAGNGTVAFAGSATVSGTITFNNATLAGSVNFGTGSTINGILSINSGGFVNTNAPNYSSGSTLRYNTGSTPQAPYGRSAEWSATSGRGYPHHVQISGNSTLNVHNNQDTQRQIAGNLTIDSGSTFTTSSMNVLGQPIGVVILGNVINNGTFTLAASADRVRCVNFNNNTSATTTLSTTAGGDLELSGNLIDNATFNANTRAVFFTGIGIQEISGSGTFAIDYMVVNKTNGSVKLLNNLLCEGPNGGNAITLTTSTDILDLNGFTATFGMANVTSAFSGSGLIRGGGNSSLILLGNGDMGILNIDISTPGTTNVLNNLTLNRTNTGIVTLGNALIINNTLSLTSGTLNMQNNALSGTTLTTSGTGKLQTQNTSTTPIPSDRSWSFEVEMNASSNQTVPQGNYAMLRLNTGGIKTISDNSAIAGDFVVSSPATAIVETTITFNGSSAQSITGLAYNNIAFSGTGVKTFTSNASVGSASTVTFTGAPGIVDFDGASNNLNFQLRSIEGGTASIGNTSGWTLNGKVTVERFIPAKRAWRLLTAPLKGASSNTINAN